MQFPHLTPEPSPPDQPSSPETAPRADPFLAHLLFKVKKRQTRSLTAPGALSWRCEAVPSRLVAPYATTRGGDPASASPRVLLPGRVVFEPRVPAHTDLCSSLAPSQGLQHKHIKMFLEPNSSAFAFDSLSQGTDNLIYGCYYKSKHQPIK